MAAQRTLAVHTIFTASKTQFRGMRRQSIPAFTAVLKHDFHLAGVGQVMHAVNPGAVQRPVVNAHSLAGPVQIRLAAGQAIIRVRLRPLENQTTR